MLQGKQGMDVCFHFTHFYGEIRVRILKLGGRVAWAEIKRGS